MPKYLIEVTLIEGMLGTVPKNKDIYAAFVASKAPTPENGEEEIETVQEIEEKGWTGFHTLPDGSPFIYNYMVKGFFKDACSMLRRVEGSLSSKLKAHKKIIDGLVFVSPRQIQLELSGPMGVLERPLRVVTPQGERVCLARSDVAPAGTKIIFEVNVLGVIKEDLLREWFDYGALRGLGQWRNASYGSFAYTISSAF